MAKGPSELEARQRRHRLAKDLFHAALELEPAERERFLADACGDDEELWTELSSLFAQGTDLLPSRAPGLPSEVGGGLEPLAAGTLVAARYRIESLLGEGGMGQVYRAHDTLLGLDVAFKRLRVRGPLHRQRLLEEARLARQVTHAGVCRVHDVGEADGETFLTMELLSGQPLSRVLESEGAWPVPRVRALARSLCGALAAAHDAGVLHGDLKPGNLLLTAGDGVHLVDFGLARALASPIGQALSAGSPGYMAPEQLDPDAIVDERTDLHALGLILHELLTGLRAFRGDTPADLLEQVRHSLPPPPSTLVADVDPDLDALVGALLEKEPARRPSSAAEVAALLSGREPAAAPSAHPAGGRLPRPLTQLIGREELLARLRKEIRSRPLVTLTGTGGCGKTRLAVELARQVQAAGERSVWFVDLAGLRDGEDPLFQVAHALAVRTDGAPDLQAAISAHLRDRRALLLIDNCEHVRRDAALAVRALLEDVPDAGVLATSREPLGLAGELLLRVPPLDTPEAANERHLEALACVDSVALFVERAAVAAPGFVLDESSSPLVGRACRRLDGMPLALELAATALRSVPLERLVDSLSEATLELSNPDPTRPERHATLRGVIDWSHARLEPAAAVLHRRLAVFAGGFTAAAAERTCAAAPLDAAAVRRHLARLVDLSLVEMERRHGQVRYRALEPVRDHAKEQLAAAGESELVAAAHLRCFVELAETVGPRLRRIEAEEALGLLDLDLANLRAALQFAASFPARAIEGLRLGSALFDYFQAKGQVGEIRSSLQDLLATAGDGESDAEQLALARACQVASLAASAAAAHEEAMALARRAESIAGRLGDQPLVALALHAQGRAAADGGDVAAARDTLDRARELAQAAGAEDELCIALNGLGNLLLRTGRCREADEHYTRALELARRRGLASVESGILKNLAITRLERGRPAEARALAEEGHALAQRLYGGSSSFAALGPLGTMRLLDGDAEGAIELLEQGLELARRSCDAYAQSSFALNLTLAQRESGALEAARECLRGALEDAFRSGSSPGAMLLAEELVRQCVIEGRHEPAARLFGAVDEERRRRGLELTPRRKEGRQEELEDLRGLLGERTEPLIEEGRGMGLRAAVESALGE